MTTSRRNTIMLWMAYTEFFYPGCELQPGYFYLSIPELYYIPEDGACIGAVGVDAYRMAAGVSVKLLFCRFQGGSWTKASDHPGTLYQHHKYAPSLQRANAANTHTASDC